MGVVGKEVWGTVFLQCLGSTKEASVALESSRRGKVYTAVHVGPCRLL